MRRKLLALAGIAAGVTAVVAAILATSGNNKSGPASLEESVLRLTDLPRGYILGDDRGCGVVSSEGRPAALATALGSSFPPFCTSQFERYDGHQPFSIESTVVELPSEEIASRTLAVVPGLARWVLGTSESLPAEPFDFGDEAALIRFTDINTNNPGVVLAWRQGVRINLVSVTGLKEPQLTEYSQELATLQQKRTANPEALTEEDFDDRTVALDRKDLGVPVYWLGEHYSPRGSLPEMTLSGSHGPLYPGGGAGNKVDINYRPESAVAVSGPPSTGIRLTIWEMSAWGDFVESELGDYATAPPCGDPKVIELGDRRIEIHQPGSGFDPGAPRPPLLTAPASSAPNQDVHNPPAPPDPDGENQCPPSYVGHVYFDQAVVAINLVICFSCTGPGGAYDSQEGIEAIGRALVRR